MGDGRWRGRLRNGADLAQRDDAGVGGQQWQRRQVARTGAEFVICDEAYVDIALSRLLVGGHLQAIYGGRQRRAG